MGYSFTAIYRFWHNQQFAEMLFYSFLGFFITLFIGHPQIIVGIIVNAALVVAALRLDTAKIIPVILTPSLGVLARGLIFGPYTIYIVYMIPFIWVGNALLVYFVKKFSAKKIQGLCIGIISKTLFLFSTAFVLVQFNILPVLFMTSFGIMQLVTAVLGGAGALGIVRIKV